MLQKKEGKARFGLTMSPDLFQRIDKERGLIPRATYIEHCLKQYFESRDNMQKTFDEILSALPEKVTREDPKKLRALIENLRLKIIASRKSIYP